MEKLGPSGITFMTPIDKSQGFKLSGNDRMTESSNLGKQAKQQRLYDTHQAKWKFKVSIKINANIPQEVFEQLPGK